MTVDWPTAETLAAAMISAGLSLGVLALALAAVTWARRWRRSAADRSDLTAREDLLELMGEMQRLGQRIDRRIESRLGQLAATLVEADEKIARLRELLGKADALAVETEAASNPVEVPSANVPQLEGTFVFDAPGAHASRGANGQDETDDDAACNPRHAQIARLGRQGLPPVEIARLMEMNVGEVELVLNLLLTGRKLR